MNTATLNSNIYGVNCVKSAEFHPEIFGS
ncbi:hypothetical protein AGR2A_pa80015 [Agrobacterium genomosp. 2 str. CFBP 5494]|uniref:Uncharacterized protein n=1 Tax=Agrobacterium genomosp. 2 str. CFBP 5494 TaxID=1183436 RepID=A0A9W5B7A7_9HYPH|nr:hypothetical protein AGR2A_pa80015 [Agrobacterium genomosp. 2 str. CFBP 5494]CUX65636.1 hypothetical protein AGR5A_pa30016 [Agrobacterium genomosp. 5 str. CFBP 6626]